jgi:hypothetical protein
MILHRIYLGGDNAKGGERFDLTAVSATVARFFPAFTVIPTIGYWNACREGAYVIEIAADDSRRVKDCARALALRFAQDAVGVAEVGTFELIEN